jgi:hypothetical protein
MNDSTRKRNRHKSAAVKAMMGDDDGDDVKLIIPRTRTLNELSKIVEEIEVPCISTTNPHVP